MASRASSTANRVPGRRVESAWAAPIPEMPAPTIRTSRCSTSSTMRIPSSTYTSMVHVPSRARGPRASAGRPRRSAEERREVHDGVGALLAGLQHAVRQSRWRSRRRRSRGRSRPATRSTASARRRRTPHPRAARSAPSSSAGRPGPTMRSSLRLPFDSPRSASGTDAPDPGTDGAPRVRGMPAGEWVASARAARLQAAPAARPVVRHDRPQQLEQRARPGPGSPSWNAIVRAVALP